MLPRSVTAAFQWASLGRDQERTWANVPCVEDQAYLRAQLAQRGLVAFVGNGFLLARESGASDLPLASAVPFQSSPALEVEVTLPNAGAVMGMGLPRGVTVVAGGGFHGKYTLLSALEAGVYDHVPGDRRTRLVAVGEAV